ncbi:MAG: glycine cleavage system aminomethyltransferase GcvT [candidate division WOR-3 bacterium]
MKTPLYELHLELNAKMVNFHDWQMPLFYESIIKEHNWTRENCSIFDVSHMGRIIIEGKDSKDFLNYITTINIYNLKVNQAKYGLMLNENAGIIDDLVVYKISDEEFLLVVNAGTTQKDLNHIYKFSNNFNVKVEDISKKISQISVQGPKAKEILEKFLNMNLDIPYYSFINKDEVLISRTGYTPEDGFEIYINSGKILEFTKELLKFEYVKMAGLGARDTLRLEAGYCLYGNDIDENTNPISANLKWAVYLEKDFIGKEKLIEILNKGVDYIRIGFISLDRSIPREKNEIYFNNEKVGNVTSGTFSPSLKRGIGMGYIKKEFSEIGREIIINSNKFLITKLPFVEGSLKNIKSKKAK